MRQNIILTAETNKIVHKMRRGMWWGRIVTVIFWIVIIVAPFAAYYYYFQSYLQPYVQKLELLYTQIEQGNQQAQQYQSQLSSFFGNMLPNSTTTKP